MGRVYKARVGDTAAHVAIKVLHPRLADDPKLVRRFHREARAARSLAHPNSLRIVDFGTSNDGILYIAMELLEGEDLLKVIERDAPFRPRRIFSLMRQVLDALEAAHEANIVHRDLKPENVVALDRGGREHIKVCDFGIAKLLEPEGGSAITISGFVCGTPEYMAPEQARGEELDRRADIYAAGCMLYQMLTATMPFRAESPLGVITKHITERPDRPRHRKPEWRIPAALERVCLKAMAKDRDARYPTAREMSAALERAVGSLGDDANVPLGQGVAPTPSSDSTPTPRRLLLWVAAGLIALGAIAVGLALIGPTPDPTPSAHMQYTGNAHASQAAEQRADARPASTRPTALTPSERDAGIAAATPVPAKQRRSITQVPQRTRAPNHQSPTPPTDVIEAADAYEQGRQRFRDSDIPGAITAFETAARQTPNSARVWKQLGRARMRAGNVHRAVQAYQRYLALAPDAADRLIVERIIEGNNR